LVETGVLPEIICVVLSAIDGNG